MSSYINFKNFGDTSHPELNCSRPMVSNPSLTRQSSIYSLTFDELQNTLGGPGKDFGSMNMDELLKNIWTAEETQAMTSTSNFGLDASVPNNGNIQRQGSLTLPRTLSQKTVDEVWRELLKGSGSGSNGGVKDGDLLGGSNLQIQESPPTLGEMTLENFLLKAGVVAENSQSQPNERPLNGGFFGDLSQQNVNNNSFIFGFQNQNRNQNHGFRQQGARNHGPMVNQITDNKNGAHTQSPNLALNLQANLQGVGSIQQQMTKPQPQPQPQPQPLFPKQAAVNFTSPLTSVNNGQLGSHGNRVPIVGKTDDLVKTSVAQASGIESGLMNIKPRSSPNFISKSNFDASPSPPSYAFGEGGVRGRKSSGTLEKVVERRRKRMIKNRESAARSRARKQAYTMELEAEVVKLKELNHELQRKQEEIMEMQKNEVMEKVKYPWGSKRLCLRRTLTGPW